jgi:hypothetical protein
MELIPMQANRLSDAKAMAAEGRGIKQRFDFPRRQVIPGHVNHGLVFTAAVTFPFKAFRVALRRFGNSMTWPMD